MTGPPESEDWLWPGTRLRIAKVLTEADGPLPGSEIARLLNADTSNINKELVALETAGLLSIQPPDPAEPPPAGRPSRYWILDDVQRAIAQAVLSEHSGPRRPPRRTRRSDNGSPAEPQRDSGVRTGAGARESQTLAAAAIGAGMELVIVDAQGGQAVDLMRVLAESEEQLRTTWTALCGDDLIFAFSSGRPADQALDLIAVLRRRGIRRTRRATVARVWPDDEFGQRARFSTGAADRHLPEDSPSGE